MKAYWCPQILFGITLQLQLKVAKKKKKPFTELLDRNFLLNSELVFFHFDVLVHWYQMQLTLREINAKDDPYCIVKALIVKSDQVYHNKLVEEQPM